MNLLMDMMAPTQNCLHKNSFICKSVPVIQLKLVIHVTNLIFTLKMFYVELCEFIILNLIVCKNITLTHSNPRPCAESVLNVKIFV